ncbi:MAG: hypothetical protein ACK8QZ_06315, partial [Anaerolineales bacterium]
VWLTRVLLIGTFAIAGERIFTLDARPRSAASGVTARPTSTSVSRPASAYSPASNNGARIPPGYNRPEPTYHNLSAQGRSAEGHWE